MKKITFLFSLLLLFFVGGLTASAQNWQEDEKLDYVPDEETPVALFHPGTSGDSPARWWAGTNAQTTDELTNKGLVIFEPTGEDFFDSFLEEDVPTYRLKDYATGKYLKDVRLSDYMDSSDYTGQPVTDWTENVNEAFVFTVMPGEEGDGANPRALVNSNKQSTGDGEFVLCSTYTYTFSGETVYTYLGAIAQPFLAPWQDTNAWQIFSVREKQGLEVLEALLQEYFPNGVDESTYAVGPNPGQYNAQIVSQVQAIAIFFKNFTNNFSFQTARYPVSPYSAPQYFPLMRTIPNKGSFSGNFFSGRASFFLPQLTPDLPQLTSFLNTADLFTAII